MADLLPCPFCGEKYYLISEHMEGTSIHPAFRIRCDNCGASSAYTDKNYTQAWNTRAHHPKSVEGLVEKIEKLLLPDSLKKDALNCSFKIGGVCGYNNAIADVLKAIKKHAGEK